jgi:hypothetical protein
MRASFTANIRGQSEITAAHILSPNQGLTLGFKKVIIGTSKT